MAVDAVMSGGGFGFLLPASAYEPEDVAFSLASPAIKARLHAEAGRVAARVWDASRATGLDRMGKPLAPIAPATVEARRKNRNPVTGRKPYSPMGRAKPSAPPLTPVNGASRTRAYLRHRTAPGRGVWFWHKFDNHTRHYWGEILARHGRGFVQRFRSGFRFVPPRDVLGFSDAELAAVREAVGAWWAARRPKGLAVPFAIDRPVPAPVPVPGVTARRPRREFEDINPAVRTGDYGLGSIDAGDGWKTTGLQRRLTGYKRGSWWDDPPRKPPAVPGMTPPPVAMPRPVNRAVPIPPPLPVRQSTKRLPAAIVARIERTIGERLTRDTIGVLALMARQVRSAAEAEAMARNAANADLARLWRAVAIILRARFDIASAA